MIQKPAKAAQQVPKTEPVEPASMDEIALLHLEKELSSVEAEWERRRQSLLVRDDNGNAYEPDDPQVIILSIVTIAGGILIPLSSGLSFASSGLGLGVTVAGVLLMMHARSKASDFTRLRNHYSAQRMRIVMEISRLRNGSPTLRARLREKLFRFRPQTMPKGAQVRRRRLPPGEDRTST